MKISDEIWRDVCTKLKPDDIVAYTVTSHEQFGMLVMLDEFPVWGVIERIRMEKDGYRTPDDYAPVGSRRLAYVVGLRNYSRQVDLALPPALRSKHQGQVEIELGVRFDSDRDFWYFGVDEVNQEIAYGKVVREIKKGRALFLKSTTEDGLVSIRHNGFSIVVSLSENENPEGDCEA